MQAISMTFPRLTLVGLSLLAALGATSASAQESVQISETQEISATIIAAPRLGATVLVVTIIAGQVAVAMVLDHKGWLGFEERPISLGRVAGIACLIAGVYLTRRF